MKLLIICGPTTGDVVFSTPAIRALKIQLDDPEIHVLVLPEVRFLVEENPYVAVVHTFKGLLSTLWWNLKKERYDLIVNLNPRWRSKLLSLSLFGTPQYSLKSIFWRKWLMVNLKINNIRSRHAVDRIMHALRPLGIKADNLGLDYFLPDRDKVALEWLPTPFRKGFVVFCLSATFRTRKLPLDRMLELCDKINKPIVLIGSQDDAENAEVISSFFSGSLSVRTKDGIPGLGRTVVYNACGKFNFNQMASLIKRSCAVFTFDNDFVPVASAFRKEVIGLWGNTVPLFGKYPYRTRYTILEHNNLGCRPCSAKGFDECPKGHFRCMREIMFDFYLP